MYFRIIVLEDGEMAGMGTHKELLGSCKLYMMEMKRLS